MLELKNRSELTVINVANAILAVFLFVSPWLVGFREMQAAARNAWILGIVIFVIAVAAASALREWEEWVNCVLGLWTIVAPWILGFAAAKGAMWTHVAVGIAVAVLAAIELWLIHSGPPAKTA